MNPTIGDVRPAGALATSVIRDGLRGRARSLTVTPAKELSFEEVIRYGFPQSGLPAEVNRWRRANIRNLARGARRVAAHRLLRAAKLGLPTLIGQLSLVIVRADGETVDLGLASMRVVTDTGVQFMVDAFQNLVELEIMKYHGIGTGTGVEGASDTALGTELTTQYNPDSTRATGSLTEGASANIYRTVGTNTVDATVAITEHMILSQAATGGGVGLDRSKFAAVNLNSGDSLQSTYDLTLASGG
jgi:hypothetical protein